MIELVFLLYLKSSVIVSFVVLALLFFSNYFTRKYSIKWKYWIWLILAVFLVLPIQYNTLKAPIVLNIPNQSHVDNILSSSTGSLETSQIMPENSSRKSSDSTLSDVKGWRMGGMQIVIFVWITGALTFLSYHFNCYFRNKRRSLHFCRKPKSNDIACCLKKIQKELHMSKSTKLLINKRMPSPMVIGFTNPYLLLPHENYSECELYYVIKHEMIHLKRKDIWYKFFLLFVNAIHWFNPAVHLMFQEACKDLEMSCDSLVVQSLHKDRRLQYCETILATANTDKQQSKSALASNFEGDAKMLKKRLINLATSNKKSGFKIAALAILIIIVTGGLVACQTSHKTLESLSQQEVTTDNVINATSADENTVSVMDGNMQEPSGPVRTADNISMIDEEFAEQRAAMMDWLDGLDKNNYAGIGYRHKSVKDSNGEEINLNDMILYMMDVEKFATSQEMKEARDDGWLFCVEPGIRSIHDLETAANKLLDQKDKFKIEKVVRRHDVESTDNILFVYTSDNSEKNLKDMEDYAGISGLELPNLRIQEEDFGKSHPGYYKDAGIPNNEVTNFYGRPYLYRVVYHPDSQEGQRAGFILQYDSPKTNEELNKIIEQRIYDTNGTNYPFEYILAPLELIE